MNWIKKIIIFLCICIILGIGLFYKNSFFPHWIVWEKAVFQDSSEDYQITLKHRKVSVRYADNIIWSTPKDIKVQKIVSGDIDCDKQDELILLCWRKGHYGDVKPIWVEEDDNDWVQHIFVYDLMPEEISAKWMSSYIGMDISDISIDSNDSLGILIKLKPVAGEESSWRWDSWGFTRVDIP